MQRFGKIVWSVLAGLIFSISWAFLYAGSKNPLPPVVALAFLAGVTSGFASVYTKLQGRSCLVGFITVLVGALAYNLIEGAPAFALPLVLIYSLLGGALPFGAGYLLGFWLAMGGKIIAHRVRNRPQS
jgi:hypothetical protein